MNKIKISQEFYSDIENKCKHVAKNLATEARNELYKKYTSLVSLYYSSSDYQLGLNKYDEPYYHRTYKLYKSANKYYLNSHGTVFYGGIKIGAEHLSDYNGRTGNSISANDVFETYIYNKNGTWHGGNWHGGYGVPSSINIFEKIHQYRDTLYEDIKSRCTI